MVGPRTDQADRERLLRLLRVGFALLVGVSMGLVVLHGGGNLTVLGTAVVGGTLAGTGLAWWVFPDSIAEHPNDRFDR